MKGLTLCLSERLNESLSARWSAHRRVQFAHATRETALEHFHNDLKLVCHPRPGVAAPIDSALGPSRGSPATGAAGAVSMNILTPIVSRGDMVQTTAELATRRSCHRGRLRAVCAIARPDTSFEVWRSRRHGFRRFAKYSSRRVARSWMMITLNCSKSLGPFSRSFVASSFNLKLSTRSSLMGSG